MLSPQVVSELNLLFAEELNEADNVESHKRSRNWNCPIQEVQLGTHTIIPLTSPREVKSEGYMMQNCVRDYIGRCRDGCYLLFSIRTLAGNRIATLGATKRHGRWYFDDCLGGQNSEVLEQTFEDYDDNGCPVFETEYTEIFSVAHDIIRRLNDKRND